MKTVDPVKLPSVENIKILIVDDDPVVLKVLKSFVASFGYPFSTAKDGIEAIEQLDNDDFMIVVTDINMPNMDGMELLQHVEKHHPQTGVIVITGLSEEYSYVDVVNAGAIDFMTKPFDRQELLAKLQRVIREQALVQELEQLSICDSLTGLYNRRYFDSKMIDELHRADRQGYPLFLSIIDVDNFKGYNDTYGHLAGDSLLSTLGNIMFNCARRGVDWAFRYGGDEFAIIITQASEEQALKVNNRIIETYRNFAFGKTTLSTGISEFTRTPGNEWEQEIEDLINRADKALYQAKNSGKDRIVVGRYKG